MMQIFIRDFNKEIRINYNSYFGYYNFFLQRMLGSIEYRISGQCCIEEQQYILTLSGYNYDFEKNKLLWSYTKTLGE